MTRAWKLSEIAAAVDGEVVAHSNSRQIDHVVIGENPIAEIDARAIVQGQIFVALQGTRSHGVQHALQAFKNGCSLILAGAEADEKDILEASLYVPVVRSQHDGVTAFGMLARAWSALCGFTVVGVTGSSGKTSTKDILRALLSPIRTVVASRANFNNEIGVPLTLVQAPSNTEIVICEMGMRGPDQISYLCSIAEPEVGVITNAGSAHLELLGSLEAIADAKAELIAGVQHEGTAVVPHWQSHLLDRAARTPKTVMRFASVDINNIGNVDVRVDCRVEDVKRTPSGLSGFLEIGSQRLAFDLPVHGLRQADNLAAAACAYHALVGSTESLAAALSTVEITGGRGNRRTYANGNIVIDDAYNANPQSVVSALEELAAIDAGRTVAVLGYMAELGPTSAGFHHEIGLRCADLGIDHLVVASTQPECDAIVGGYEDGGGARVSRFDGVDETIAAIESWHQEGDVTLVKASNSVGLRRVVSALDTSNSAAKKGGVR